jgi:hypothetical protein
MTTHTSKSATNDSIEFGVVSCLGINKSWFELFRYSDLFQYKDGMYYINIELRLSSRICFNILSVWYV